MLPVYVDFDDVLCETAKGLLDLLAREFGKIVAYEDLISFDLQVSLGLTPGELEHFFGLAHEPDALLSYAPVPNALEILNQWAMEGVEVVVVTGRPGPTREASLKWLENHGIPSDRLIIVDKYGRSHLGSNGVLSMERLTAIDFSLAVEDAPQMAHHIAARMDTPVVLIDRPWNRRLAAHKKITRVASWAEVQPGKIV